MRSLRQDILKLLEKDKEFRYAVAGLIGFREIMDKLAEHDRKFNEIMDRLAEHDRKFNEIMSRLMEHDRKFNEIMDRMERLEDEFRNLSLRVEVTIGSMGRRWGSDLEMMVLEIFKETLEREGIKPGEVRKFRFKDEDGNLTGMKGRILDVDILIKNSALYVIEVKSRAELDHVEYLKEKARFVGKLMGRKVDRILVVAVNVDKEAYERARELGIDVICAHVIE